MQILAEKVYDADDPRPRVLYVSYDGASEPLGRSQVVAYLLRLARDCDVTLISFEKPADDRDETRRMLENAGIDWIPLRYHRRPPMLSTAWDIFRGARIARSATLRQRTQIVHARSYVAAVLALLSARRRPWSLVFDIRGFWVDERVEGGLWPRNGPLYRMGKRCERWLFGSADAVVTLTRASLPQIEEWLGHRDIPIRVIPTCVALEHYTPQPPRASPRVTWCGSVSNFYRIDLALKLVDALKLPLSVLTRQVDLARAAVGNRPAQIITVPHERISEHLVPGDIGMCIGSSGFANLARAPTRFAEYLAAGMVVAVTPGIGDLDALVTEHRVGAVLRSGSAQDVAEAARQLRRLAADPDTPNRGRALAERIFDVDQGAAQYRALYADLLRQRVEQWAPGASPAGASALRA